MFSDKLIEIIELIYDELEYKFDEISWNVHLKNGEILSSIRIVNEDENYLYCIDSLNRIHFIIKENVNFIVANADKQVQQLINKHKIKGYI